MECVHVVDPTQRHIGEIVNSLKNVSELTSCYSYLSIKILLLRRPMYGLMHKFR